MAAGAFRPGFVFLGARHFDQVEETARTAAEALQPLVEEGGPEAMPLWDGLTPHRAVAASRLDRADAAYEHPARAREVAERLGDWRNDYDTEFGPANVALHEVAVAIELGDAGRALRVGTAVDTSTLSPERRARLGVDPARAHARRRRADEAVPRCWKRRRSHPSRYGTTASSGSWCPICRPCRIRPPLTCENSPSGWARRK